MGQANEILDVYCLQRASSGRVLWFTNHIEALRAAKGHGVFSPDASVFNRKAVKVDGEIYLLASITPSPLVFGEKPEVR